MGTYAARALPWPLLLVTGGLVVLVLRVLQLDPWTLWPLQGVALGLLAGGIGWCLDEPSAGVVDTLPRGPAWRTAARCSGVLLLVLAWSAAVLMARDDLFGHALAVWWQGVCLALAALAATTWARVLGHAAPGRTWAVAVVPLATVWALVRPAPDRIPLLPYADGHWTASVVLWTVVGAISLVALVAALVEAHWWPAARRPLVRRRGPAPA